MYARGRVGAWSVGAWVGAWVRGRDGGWARGWVRGKVATARDALRPARPHVSLHARYFRNAGMRLQNGRLACSQNRVRSSDPSWSLPVAVGLGLLPMRRASVAFTLNPWLATQPSDTPPPFSW